MVKLINNIEYKVRVGDSTYFGTTYRKTHLDVDMYLFGEHLGRVEFRRAFKRGAINYALSYFETINAPYFSLDYKMLVQLAADYLKSLGYNNIEIINWS